MQNWNLAPNDSEKAKQFKNWKLHFRIKNKKASNNV